MASETVVLGASSSELLVVDETREPGSTGAQGNGSSSAEIESSATVWAGKDFLVAIQDEGPGSPATDGGAWRDFPDGGKGYLRNGTLCTGWTQIGDAWYNFDQDARMLVGWNDVPDTSGATKTYFFRPSGSMATGWAEIDGAKYYFRPDGSLLTGWLTTRDEMKNEERHYLFAADGRMVTGWQEIDGLRLFFRPTGSLATGWANIDGTGTCYFDESGALATGWRSVDGRWYYFNENGAMQTGRATIEGESYSFSDKGVLDDDAVPVLAMEGEAELGN
jgi:glucan-binding YG repeat protein